jgi:signal transduction histidine kinase
VDRGLRRRAGDLGIAFAVGLLYVMTALGTDADVSAATRAVSVVLGVAVGVALAARRDRPMGAAVAAVAADTAFQGLMPGLVIPFAGLVALWSATLRLPPRRSLIVLAGVSATASLNAFRTTADETTFTLLLGVCVWALAEAARNRISAAEESARRVLSDERARIARELHDVVAHSVSVIVVQAAAAGDVFDDRPDQARAALSSIEGAGREALAELRRLVAAVRPGEGDGDGGGGEDLPSEPQPGLAQVSALAAQLRSAGLDVVVREDGEPFPLPAGVDLSAFRIVQEALTNTLRHAHATTAEVTLRYEPGVVELDVVDDGRPTIPRAHGAGTGTEAGNGGLGLVGMHERATMLGGVLEAGPTAHGGFRVRARLPVEAR